MSSKEYTTTITTSSQEMKGLNIFLNSRTHYTIINPNRVELEKTIALLPSFSFNKILNFLDLDLNSAINYLNLVFIQVSEITTKRREKKRRKTKRKQSEKFQQASPLPKVEINPIYTMISNLKKSYTIIYPNNYTSQDDIISKSSELFNSSFKRILMMLNLNWEDAFNYMSITVVNYLYEEIKRKTTVKKKKQKRKKKKIIQEVDIDPSFKRMLEFLKIFNVSCSSNLDSEGMCVPVVSFQRIIRMLGIHWYYIVEYLQVNITIFTELQSYQRSRIKNLNRKANTFYDDKENEHIVSIFAKENSCSKWNKHNEFNFTELFDLIERKSICRKKNSFIKRIRFDQDRKIIPLDMPSDDGEESEEERIAVVKKIIDPIFQEYLKYRSEICQNAINFIFKKTYLEIDETEGNKWEIEKSQVSTDGTAYLIQAALKEISQIEKDSYDFEKTQVSYNSISFIINKTLDEILAAYVMEKTLASTDAVSFVFNAAINEIDKLETKAYELEKCQVSYNSIKYVVESTLEEIDKLEIKAYEYEKFQVSTDASHFIIQAALEEIKIKELESEKQHISYYVSDFIEEIFRREKEAYQFLKNSVSNLITNQIIENALEEIGKNLCEQLEKNRINQHQIFFNIRRKINYGDAIYITGSCDELFNWNLHKAVRLDCFNTNNWIKNIDVNEISFPFQFRYFISNWNKINFPVQWIEKVDFNDRHFKMIRSIDNDCLKVMSFNIRYENEIDNFNSWRHRKDLIPQMLTFHSCDIIGIQEAKQSQVSFVHNSFIPIYSYVGTPRSSDPNDEQCGIFFNHQKFSSINSGYFWLSDTPWIKGSISFGNVFPRMATWVLLKQTRDIINHENNRIYLAINTHLDHVNSFSRLPCIKALVHEINIIVDGELSQYPDEEIVMILTGCFYSQDSDASIVFLKNSGFISTSDEMENTQKTFHNFSGYGLSKYDYIFYKIIRKDRKNFANLTKSYEIIEDHEIKDDHIVYLSDHFPIKCVIGENNFTPPEA